LRTPIAAFTALNDAEASRIPKANTLSCVTGRGLPPPKPWHFEGEAMSDRPRRQILGVLVLVLACGWFCLPARAYVMGEFDYFNEPGNLSSLYLNDAENYVAQTFLCERDGAVTVVDLVLQSYPANNPGSVPLTVQLRTTYDSGINGILPTNTVLATGQIAHDQCAGLGDWSHITMSAADLFAGQTYAIAIKTDPKVDEAYKWYGRWTPGSDPYPPGRTCIYYPGSGGYFNFLVNSDLGFRVNGVPEPATIGLMALGVLPLLRRKRR
jgi:hypothetical protein